MPMWDYGCACYVSGVINIVAHDDVKGIYKGQRESITVFTTCAFNKPCLVFTPFF